ncbi:DinB family protein [Fibrella forsythiae]|uniref:DinB family protein n=1 Tax=Fibrella forsythiae TaxID=2817061 RepID=A0ABS3JQH7_9BACT|nr:DinB family protein [Fibrella forsythiae]MBO0951464.1 DinB family protein [Fibrella forsythiae]
MITRPTAAEYLPFANTYVQHVPEGQDPLDQLRTQADTLKLLLANVSDEQALFRYAPGKWSIKESLVHMIDTERIFAYRALRIGRGDQTPLPGFEQDDYVPASGADARLLADIWHEYDTVRAATLSLFESFTPDVYARAGMASGHPLSMRALAHIIPGHEAHHISIFRDRYLPGLV